MKHREPERELLLRYLDGNATLDESQRVVSLLRADPEAREFVREVAEQSVMVADLERIVAGQQQAIRPRAVPLGNQSHKIVAVRFFTWQRILAAAAVLCVLAVLASRFLPKADPEIVRVVKVTGSSQYFGANGKVDNALRSGTILGVGDTLETRSCDAWIELKLRDASTITIAGHSTLRILDGTAGGRRFEMSQGSLWANPAAGATAEVLSIQTPTMTTEVRGGQFDIQTSATESIVRVNEGSARVSKFLDGGAVTVGKGQQVYAVLGRKEPLAVTAQPAPINHWACDLGRVHEVILGRWLPPTANESARLGADPLLWPIPGRAPVMLYAVALAAWKSTEHPVLLQSDSRLRIRGRTDKAQRVRFGFSTQKIRGVFAGKFEVDMPPAALGPAGRPWEVELPLSDFRPLQPQLSSRPDGLELTDIYALTIQEDAGLEINHLELVPGNQPAGRPAPE